MIEPRIGLAAADGAIHGIKLLAAIIQTSERE